MPGRWSVKLVLAGSHRLVIEALAMALTRRGFAVAALAASPREVFAQVAEHQPDICLLAAAFPACSGLGVLRVIGKRHPGVKVVMLSAGPDPGLMAAAIGSGAAGLIARDCHIIDIVRTILRVRQGERVFDDALLGGVDRGFRLPGNGDGNWLRVLLTSREQEVLMRIVEGESTRQMARSLAISDATVRTHIQNVFVKLGVHSRLEATSVAAESGVLGRYLPGMPAWRAAGGG